MFKVVIIDDEPIIIEGLSKIIQWDKYECEVVATALDGVKGAEIIREVKPDILMTDIAMPGCDGLTMVAGLKSEFPNMQIAVLTGYRDFDYAQEAIRLGVARFLLKPSNLEELMEAVGEMTSRLGQLRREDLLQEKPENSASSFIVKNAIKYIEDNYDQKLTLSEVAEKIYVSQWHLSKLLNKHAGQSFLDILNSARINEAKKLLRNPSLRIGDVSEMVGFTDMAHFSRVFKRVVGVSANEFRNTIEPE